MVDEALRMRRQRPAEAPRVCLPVLPVRGGARQNEGGQVQPRLQLPLLYAARRVQLRAPQLRHRRRLQERSPVWLPVHALRDAPIVDRGQRARPRRRHVRLRPRELDRRPLLVRAELVSQGHLLPVHRRARHAQAAARREQGRAVVQLPVHPPDIHVRPDAPPHRHPQRLAARRVRGHFRRSLLLPVRADPGKHGGRHVAHEAGRQQRHRWRDRRREVEGVERRDGRHQRRQQRRVQVPDQVVAPSALLLAYVDQCSSVPRGVPLLNP
mmetsp:Transcript_3644/g.11452  ORF Transcript_3644/g.11452 Transcript_3644/m.11452 type:complete len:268 (+) Transcript_3644:114-917(+)